MIATQSFRFALGVAGLVLALSLPAAARAQGGGKRTAPLYPGAVALEKDQVCSDTAKWSRSHCTQFARDGADKVKAFYDGKIGAKRFLADGPAYFKKMEGSLGGGGAVADTTHFAPLAWHYTVGEAGIGDAFSGVIIQERRTPAWPAATAQASELMGSSRFFSKLQRAVNWTGLTGPGTEGSRTPAQMKEVFAKYSYLEARYLADPEALNRLTKKYEDLEAQRKKAADAQGKQAEGRAGQSQKAMMDQMTQQQQASQQVLQGKDEQVNADRAEMDALMKRKPGLWAKAKPSYDKGNALMNEGMKDMNEAKLKQAEVEMKKANDILRSDPEVAALQDKQTARQNARGSEAGKRMMESATAMQKSAAAVGTTYSKAHADAIWLTWTEYLAEAAKLDMYRTEIRVDFAPAGEGKDYSDKPDTVAGKWKTKKWEDPGASKRGEDSGTGPAASASGPKAAPAQSKQAAAKPAEEKKSATDDAADTAKKAGAEGMKLLKKLF